MSTFGSISTTSLFFTFIVDFAIQLAFYIYSSAMQTEKFYDVSASITYISCVLVALCWRQLDDRLETLSPRQIVAALTVLVWAVRLGSYLFWRILKEGDDKRFATLKKNPIQFAIPWFLQVVWIFLTPLPVYIILGNRSSEQPTFGSWSDILGLIIWAFGFVVEVRADTQKTIFKNKYPKQFISTGIWAWSRYANYNGEITLWIGSFILCAGGFVEGWQWVGIISPIFVAGLICGISGIPLLEKSSQERYGALPEYQAYKARTSKFFLWPPKRDGVALLEGVNEPSSLSV
ncbi:hypothetical protein BJ742DRAFT_703369 [Cladochytrium replicatum]|nr:hypothetical protein BJ742DRAFT_703369 [Cladochytrium replicatum]